MPDLSLRAHSSAGSARGKDFWDGKDWAEGRLRRPDPRIEQVIRALSGLYAKVDQLADQVDALKKSRG